MRRFTALLALAILTFPFTGFARALPSSASLQATQTTAISSPAVLKVILAGGFRVVRHFPAASSLTGWVVQSSSGQYTVLFSTPDGKTLIAGALISSLGQNLAKQYYERYVPRPDLRNLWKSFHKASVVVEGAEHPKSVIYVIMDPNCIYCHMLWIALQPYEAEGLQVRWVPVGFLHQDSPGKAAAVLKGGVAALEREQQGFNVQTESGGIRPAQITPGLKKELVANEKLMHDAQVEGTPGIFYKDKAGQVLRKDGMPLMSELPAITGLPARKESAPLLANFNH